MSTRHVHNCVQLVDENETLKRLIRKVKRENDELKARLGKIEEKQKVETLLKQYVTTRDTQVQTEIPGLRSFQPSVLALQHRVQKTVPKQPPQQDDNAKVNKMLIMHNNMMKRYEKEVKVNMEHIETITKLSLRISELESKVKSVESELHELQVGRRVNESRRAVSTGRRSRSATPVWLDESDDSSVKGLLKELNRVRKERDKLVKDKKKLKGEIQGLDQGFFDEIEDLKYALHQSTKLNEQYDQALRKMSKQFGVPYPNPQQTPPEVT